MADAAITKATIKATANVDLSIYQMLISADIVVKLVILLLVLASIVSWAIIVSKYMSLNRIRKKMKTFENVFWSGQVLEALHERVKNTADNPLSSVFVSAMNECKRHNNNYDDGAQFAIKIGVKERLMQVMYLVRNREMENIEKYLGFLSVVGSSAPFVGLFGTVWGIMHSFQSIAASKNTTLAVVAPGIAEALLATAIGLFVAIPAVIFYNLLVSEITKLSNKLDDFIGELYNLLGRAIDEDKLQK